MEKGYSEHGKEEKVQFGRQEVCKHKAGNMKTRYDKGAKQLHNDGQLYR